MNFRNIWNIFLKDLKHSRGWLIFVPAGILAFSLYVLLKLSRPGVPEAAGNIIILTGFLIFPIIILIFIRGISVIKSERDNRTLEYLKSLPVSGFDIITAKALLTATESLIYVLAYVASLEMDFRYLQYKTISLTIWSVLFLWGFVWIFATLALLLQVIGMSMRKYGKLIGFISFFVITWLTKALARIIEPFLDLLPSVHAIIFSSPDIARPSNPISLGYLGLFIIISIIYSALAGYLTETKVEV